MKSDNPYSEREKTMKKLLFLLLLGAFLMSGCTVFLTDESSSNPSETEPNDYNSTADQISVGTTYDASITEYDDQDTFTFSYNYNTTYTVNVRWVSGTDLDLQVGLYDYNGYLMYYDEYNAVWADENFDMEDETLSFSISTAYSGGIYLTVYDYWDAYYGGGTYTITVTSSSGGAERTVFEEEVTIAEGDQPQAKRIKLSNN